MMELCNNCGKKYRNMAAHRRGPCALKHANKQVTELQETVIELQGTVTERDATIAERDARIAELETRITELAVPTTVTGRRRPHNIPTIKFGNMPDEKDDPKFWEGLYYFYGRTNVYFIRTIQLYRKKFSNNFPLQSNQTWYDIYYGNEWERVERSIAITTLVKML